MPSVFSLRAAAAAAATLACPSLSHGVDGRQIQMVEPWAALSRTPHDWARTTPPDSGVPASLFAKAMTSLPFQYRDNLDLLDSHLLEEHKINLDESPSLSRAHLCCGDYLNGPAIKKALTDAAAAAGDVAVPTAESCAGNSGVRTALNHPEGYCAIAHLSPRVAHMAASTVHSSARCSPLTHASKEPLGLLSPASSSSSEESFFGLALGEGMQDGPERGLVVTMSPGTLPAVDAPSGARVGDMNRKLWAGRVESLERRWKAAWASARGRDGARDFVERVPWTSSKRSAGDGGDGRRRLIDGDGGGPRERLEGDGVEKNADKFHGGKARGYQAALKHLSEKMMAMKGVGEEGEPFLFGLCRLDGVEFVHPRDDVVYLRRIYDADRDDETAAACFLGLVGFLSAQPDVLHIHHETRAIPNNKVLTAYVEGGESEVVPPMRTAGLDGSGEVIGVADTGLDDSSCFFKDSNGMVPRTTMSKAEFYPNQRKVIQYVVLEGCDEMDGDGHGTHVSGTAAGAIYSDWMDPWKSQTSEAKCEDVGYTRTCFGDCVSELDSSSCHWNPEISCPMHKCDTSTSCDEATGYPFPCFEDPVDALPEASGMAPGAKIAFFDMGKPDGNLLLPNNLGDMWDSQRAAGAKILSNSWSLISRSEPTSKDIELDEWLAANPDCLVVFGAGNDGFDDGQFQKGSVLSPATSKTAMTVGAQNSGPNRAYAYFSGSSSNFNGVLNPEDDIDFKVTPYSARGPVGDFATKPDVVAPGMMVHSAKASRSEFHEETCALESYGGTSMSAPAISGAAALMRQYFSKGILADYLKAEGHCGDGDGESENGVYGEAGLCEPFEPSGYLLKAVLINSAVWLGNMQSVSYDGKYQYMTGLDFAQGYGAVQMAAGIATNESKMGVFFHENELITEQRHYYAFYVGEPDKDLSVTVAWYDPPATVASYNLLHDLDIFVRSVSSGTYFRSNSYYTIEELCGTDNACAAKYGFTWGNHLADDVNTVERIVIPAKNLAEGLYVVGIRARSIVETESQAYGLAAAGAGVVLRDMASDWNHLDLGVETQAAAGSNANEPDPFGTESPTPLSPSATVQPYTAEADEHAEKAVDEPTSGSSGESSFLPDDGSGSDVKDSKSMYSSSGTLSAGHEVFGDNDDSPDDTTGSGSGPRTGSGGNVVGQDNDGDMKPTIFIAAAVTGAAFIIALGMCLVMRRRRRQEGTEKSIVGGVGVGVWSDLRKLPFVGKATSKTSKVTGSSNLELSTPVREEVGIQDFDMESVHMGSVYEEVENSLYRSNESLGAILPGYATAVAMEDEGDGNNVFRTSTGTPLGFSLAGAADTGDFGSEVDKTNKNDESETSLFYVAVDPYAVSKLVGWGISRDFARVALREADNDIPAALRIVAQGDMDSRLARDHQEMARQGARAAAAAASAAATATAMADEGQGDESNAPNEYS